MLASPIRWIFVASGAVIAAAGQQDLQQETCRSTGKMAANGLLHRWRARTV